MVLERQVHHAMGLLDRMREERLASLEVRREAYDAYTAAVDRAHDHMVWTHPRVRSYYQNSHGRVVVPSPFRVVDFWHMTEDDDPDAYVAEPARSRSAGGRSSA